MGREGKKLTATQKGKAIVPENKGKSKELKGLETAFNVAHAADLQRRGQGIHIRDNIPSDTQTPESPVPRSHTIAAEMTGTTRSEANPAQTPESRKRTRADDDPIQETAEIEDENVNLELVLKVKRSVVTVATVISNSEMERTIYGTGFILTAEENYCLVFTSYLSTGGDAISEYFVYFNEERTKCKASMLITGNKFSILIIRTVEKREAVIFDDDPLDNECMFMVCAMAGSKMNAVVDAPETKGVLGGLGIYEGEVTATTCDASDYKHEAVSGAEVYFQLRCDVHDVIITLENVDKENHPSNIIISSPVFRLNGKAIGMIYSSGTWGDLKVGLFAKDIFSWIKSRLGKDMWEDELKCMAYKWLKDNVQL